jgi:hypothetical protein
MSLGLDPTLKHFAIKHNVSVSECSRWLASKPRGIAPGSHLDKTMWRCHRSDIRDYRAMLRAKRHGTQQISNSAMRSSARMSA